jgi:splicing factor 45
VSGEEAFNRRAKLSGRAPSPPRAPLPADDDDIDGEALDSPQQTVSHPVSSPKESVAARMMARMGWREGSGLGKEEQGMTTALVHKKTDRKTGIIVNAPPVATAKPARAPVRIPPLSEQSKVLLLKNMVGPGEVDDDLESETASECSKYGEVIVSTHFLN